MKDSAVIETKSKPLLITRQQGACLVVSLNRPDKKNALNQAMYEQLIQAMDRAEAEVSICCMLLTTSSEHFCSGNDLSDFLAVEFKTADVLLGPKSSNALIRFLYRYRDFPKTKLVAVQGLVIGIGATLLLHSDLIFADYSATFSMPFVKLGLCPEYASSYLLPKLVGQQRAYALLILGQCFSAEQALRWGLVNDLSGSAQTAALNAAKQIENLSFTALYGSNKLLRAANASAIDQAMGLEINQFVELLASKGFKDKAAEFLAKH
ncbi:enoyl-CoA hydratase-related protein [Agaribacterium sp. ZY112]|uniref:enoyl-CoA hydratase-related protein n=1 Tax=Agaribacterium sp. ZY112 TaxID=3233574 RepID=UPI0035239CE6